MKVDERIDFNFSYKDCETIDRILNEYLKDRQSFYSELFLNDAEYTTDDVRDYITYFCCSDGDCSRADDTVHEKLPRLIHFLQRRYEIFLIESIGETVDNLLYSLTNLSYYLDLDDDELATKFDEIEETEYENIQSIGDLWTQFVQQIAEQPLINLDKMEYTVIGGVQVYYNKNIEPFIYDSFMNFLENIKKDYPNVLLMMDTFILVSPEYIEFCAGEGTQAFFANDVIFYADSCKDEDKDFVKSVYYHEFGHYIYSMLSETMMEYWHNSYLQWVKDNVKMSRNEEENSQLDEFEEELFADTFSTLYIDNGDDAYIHRPSSLVTDALLFILNEEFTSN